MAIERVARGPTALEETSTADLVREALDEAKELVRIEVQLARDEVKEEILQTKKAAIAFGIAAGAGVLLLCALTIAVVFALGGTAVAALGVAGVLVVLAVASALFGYTKLPKSPLGRTRNRLQTDVSQLKEHIA
jgi:uncharacterized membrane protein YqjE